MIVILSFSIRVACNRTGPFSGRTPMNPDAERQQQKVKEFMSLMPLTIAVAGLPECEPGRHFTDGQLEARATTIRTAYKVVRQIISDISR